jgi:hypothetical protein
MGPASGYKYLRTKGYGSIAIWFRFAINLLAGLSLRPDKRRDVAGPLVPIIRGVNEYYAISRNSNRHNPDKWCGWTGVRTYKGRGTSSYFILLFGIFLAALGMLFLFGAFSAIIREFRISSDWIR